MEGLGHLAILSYSACLYPAWAEVAPRSKRRCVLERKQPYSGDEWCSGPDSEEDDKPIAAAHSECPLMLCLMVPFPWYVCVCVCVSVLRELTLGFRGLFKKWQGLGAQALLQPYFGLFPYL